MQFLKTLLIVFTVAVAAAFAVHNWVPVKIALWGDLVADVNLPLLMGGCFLAGLLPTWLWHHAVRWRLRQRLSSTQKAVDELRTAAVVTPPSPPPVDVEPVLAPGAPPLMKDPGE